jgi:hypothetical protein
MVANSSAYIRNAKTKFIVGPAPTIAARFQTGCVEKARSGSMATPASSSSSSPSIFT